MMFEFIIWFVFVALGFVLAGKNERSPLLWGGVCFLLGPVGVIILLVLGKDYAAIERKAVSQGKLKFCPNCKELVKYGARICKHCHCELPKEVEGKDRSYEFYRKETYYDPRYKRRQCPNCSSVIKKGRVCCFECGELDILKEYIDQNEVK
ncbi:MULTISPECIES: hypothetical protein [Vibrio]|uniref:hypothetical protein n=1 Tax=Vibrio TaxID=662 RepID=UPI0035510C6D